LKKVQISLLLIILLIIPIAYIAINKSITPKIIKIPQLKIISKEKREDITPEKPSNILSKLKIAVKTSNEKSTPSKEEQAQEILQALKKNIHPIKQTKEKIVKVKKSTSIHKKPKIVKNINKKNISKYKIHKHSIHKIVEKKKPKHSYLAKKDEIQKKEPTFTTQENKITKKTHPRLSREEELAQYYEKSKNGLEIVGESKLFKIEKVTNIPDEYYFDPIKKSLPIEQNTPLKEVKTLGVVKISKKYEVDNQIPKKIELAKEAKVDIASASIETEELKKLKFVDTLEVIEVSPEFETIEAKKYIQ